MPRLPLHPVDLASGTKVCNACEEPLPLEAFYENQKGTCKACIIKRSNRWQQNNADRTKSNRQRWYRRNFPQIKRGKRLTEYGIAEGWYEKTLAQQGGACAICRSTDPKGQGRFHVDHDHKCCGPKKACDKCRRGLLCYTCNLQLGVAEKYGYKYHPFEKYLKRHELRQTAQMPSTLPLFMSVLIESFDFSKPKKRVRPRQDFKSPIGCDICGVSVSDCDGTWGNYGTMNDKVGPPHLLICPKCMEIIGSHSLVVAEGY